MQQVAHGGFTTYFIGQGKIGGSFVKLHKDL